MSMFSVRRVAAAAALTAFIAASSPASARDLRSEPAGRPDRSLFSAALALLDGFWSQVSAAITGDNGAGIDPNGVVAVPGDNGPGIDPNGLLGGPGDNGAGIDPNG